MDDESDQILKVPAVKRVLELIGLTAVYWNRVESDWELVFNCLLHEAPRKKSDELLKHFITGAAKREFIMRLAGVALRDHPELQAAIVWLNDRTNELVGQRNAIVHGYYRFDWLNGPPGLRVAPMGSTNRRPNRMAKAGSKLEGEIRATVDAIATLYEQLQEFLDYLGQNYLPPEQRTKPLSAESLIALPPHVREAMPRALREKVELRIPPKTTEKPKPRKR